MFDINKIKNIAIVRRNGLGDLLCAFPLISFLKELNPKVKITLFLDERNAPLLKYLPSLDQVILFPKKGNKYFIHLSTALRYRKQKFDLAISAKTSPMKLMNLFLYFLGAKYRLAVTNQGWHSRLINCKVLYNATLASQTHQALKSLRLISPTLSEILPQWEPVCSIPQEIAKKYPHMEKRDSKKWFFISASTTQKANRIDPAKYARIVRDVCKQFPFKVLLIAQETDRLRAHEIASHLDADHALHFTRNFDEFMLLLGQSDLVFVGDGGVGHLSAALSKRAVVLFGGVDPVQWAPLNSLVTPLYNSKSVNEIDEDKIFLALTDHARNIYRN